MTIMPEPDLTVWGRTRDKFAMHVCNFVLRRIATPWYHDMVKGAIIWGLEAAAEEVEKKQVVDDLPLPVPIEALPIPTEIYNMLIGTLTPSGVTQWWNANNRLLNDRTPKWMWIVMGSYDEVKEAAQAFVNGDYV